MIVVDAYRQPYIPFYLATREFFELVRDRLEPGGVVLVNVGHPEGEDRLEEVLGATMSAVFPTVLRDPSEDTNTQLLGSTAPGSGAQLRRGAAALPEDLRPAGAGDRRPTCAGARRRLGLHGRPCAGRMADRQLDPRLRRGGVTARPRPERGPGPKSAQCPLS